jgi:hypothetical protein
MERGRVAETTSHAPAASAAARERASIAREVEKPYCQRPISACVWVRDGYTGGMRLSPDFYPPLVKSGS